ncbi:MAG: AAA family ATPase [Candidatus Methanofastidiosum sp.]|nr:AAA family ATPase [Methanofastidiosum sp.]
MRIEKIYIKNYSRFKEIELSFNKNSDNDLHFIIGKNGSGKTDFLNAINWCLYEIEPQKTKRKAKLELEDKKDKLPRLNVYNEDKDNDKVIVEIWLAKDKEYVFFHREEVYDVKNNNLSKPIRTDFYVDIPDNKGNRKIIRDDEANLIVERFFPEAIREYFFFDGERLDRYFQLATSKDINHEIFTISYINALESMKDHTELLIKDITKKGGEFSANLEEIREKQEHNQNQLNYVKDRIDETKNQLSIAKNKISEYHSLLKNQPDVSERESKLQELKLLREQKDELLKKYEIKKNRMLFKYTLILGFWPAYKYSLETIDEKKKNLELPPVEEEIIEKVLKHDNCDICGQPLNKTSKKRMSVLLEQFKSTSKSVKKLEPMDKPLNKFKLKINEFRDNLDNINSLIEDTIKEYEYIESQISTINDELGGYDVDKIKKWHLEREKFEKIRDQNLIRLGSLKNDKKTLQQKKESLEKEFDKALKDNEKASKIRKKIKFAKRALDIIERSKVNIMNETREKIGDETNRLFFDLLWDEGIYKDIIIDKNYNLGVIHDMGYECLDELSAAQRELLALSFTLALHRISGYEAPILIDTPVARISDDNRTNFAKTFLDVTKNKQIILLFTPNEYSKEIKDLFDNRVSNKYEFIKEDKITTLGVLE